MAECSVNLGHCFLINVMSILAKKFRHMNEVIREVLQIGLHPDNLSQDIGFSLRHLAHTLKEQKVVQLFLLACYFHITAQTCLYPVCISGGPEKGTVCSWL
jgi:hypothetical protein